MIHMVKKLDESKLIAAILYFLVFAVILLCNILTPYVVDDFYYCFSFATGEPIRTLWDIFPSMAAHTQSMNGRLSAHFLVQLFVLMPQWVFDVFNSGMFCLQIALINAFFFSETRSNLRTAAIFAGIWVFELSFGQVNLWQDGAVNYLWSAVFMLGFLYPFADRFLNGKDFTDKKLAKAGFLVYALFTGSYSETASSAAIFVACLLLFLDVFCNHRKISKYGISCIVLAVAGYVSIYFAPAQFVNKSASLSPFVLAKNIANATLIYEKFGALIVTLVVLLVICAVEKVCIKRILLSLSFAAGSLAANYIMIFARYYSERSAVGAFVLLLAAIGVLIPPVLERKSWKIGLVSAMIVLVLSSVSPLLLGMLDIYITHLDIQMNEQIIHNTIAEGNLDIALPVIESGSQYGSLYKTVYLTEDSSHWINVNMAKYYGVNSLTGYTAIP